MPFSKSKCLVANVVKTYTCELKVVKQENAYWMDTYCDKDTEKVNDVILKCLKNGVVSSDGDRPEVRVDRFADMDDLRNYVAYDRFTIFNELFIVNSFKYNGYSRSGVLDLSIRNSELFSKFNPRYKNFTISMLYIIPTNGHHIVNVSINPL